MDDQFAKGVLLIVGVLVFCLVVPTALGVSICLAIAGVQRLVGKSGARSIDSTNPPRAKPFSTRSFADRPARCDAEVRAVNDAVPPRLVFDDLESDPTQPSAAGQVSSHLTELAAKSLPSDAS